MAALNFNGNHGLRKGLIPGRIAPEIRGFSDLRAGLRASKGDLVGDGTGEVCTGVTFFVAWNACVALEMVDLLPSPPMRAARQAIPCSHPTCPSIVRPALAETRDGGSGIFSSSSLAHWGMRATSSSVR